MPPRTTGRMRNLCELDGYPLRIRPVKLTFLCGSPTRHSSDTSKRQTLAKRKEMPATVHGIVKPICSLFRTLSLRISTGIHFRDPSLNSSERLESDKQPRERTTAIELESVAFASFLSRPETAVTYRILIDQHEQYLVIKKYEWTNKSWSLPCIHPFPSIYRSYRSQWCIYSIRSALFALGQVIWLNDRRLMCGWLTTSVTKISPVGGETWY